jgi:general stress protein 26
MKLQNATELEAFLDTEKAATLALPIDEAGTIHIATMNYVHLMDPFCFYFMTSDKSEKCTLLNKKTEVVAACNVGTYVDTAFTLQMRGIATILDKSEQAEVLDAYYAKRGDTNRNVEGPHSVLVAFRPNWARYTDFAKGWDTTLLDLS